MGNPHHPPCHNPQGNPHHIPQVWGGDFMQVCTQSAEGEGFRTIWHPGAAAQNPRGGVRAIWHPGAAAQNPRNGLGGGFRDTRHPPHIWQLLSTTVKSPPWEHYPVKWQLLSIIVKSPSWEHHRRVATIQESVKWQLLSKALLGTTIQGWLSKSQLSGNYCQKPFLGALSKGGHYPRVS